MTNLLPPIYKQELNDEKLRKRIIFVLFLVLVDLLLLIAIVLGLFIYISKANSNLSKEMAQKEKFLQEPDSQEIKRLIDGANQNLSKINNIKKEQVSVVDVLEKLNQLISDTAYLKSFSFQNSSRDVENKETKIIEKEFFGKTRLSGIAKNREVVFSLKKSLSGEQSFQNIYFDPLSWVKSINPDFTIEFNFVLVKK